MARLPFRRSKKEPKPNTDLVTAAIEEDDDIDDGQARMSFFEHLNELRIRITRAFIGVMIGTIIGFGLSGPALTIFQQPYCQLVETQEQCQLVTLAPTDTIVVYLRVSLMIGAALALPLITHQIMMFVLPALTRKEKRFVLLSIPAITGLFLVGAAFAWFILMPPALGFLESFQPTVFRPEWTADLYLSFVTALVFWMGAAFQTPLVFFVLSILGMVSPGMLAKNWRVAIILAAVAAALITPTIDPVNMALVMGPLLVLYLLSIGLTWFGRRINMAGAIEPTQASGRVG